MLAPGSGLGSAYIDARGLPLFGSSGYDAAAHLLREAAPFPRRHAPVSSGPDHGSTMWTDTSGMLEPHPTLRYTGPLVVLIDETNQSSLENMVFPLRLEGRARSPVSASNHRMR